MRIIYLILILFSISCNHQRNLITNSKIAQFTLNDSLYQDYNKQDFEIAIDNRNRIKSIIVKSSDYKTEDGFGVGSNLKDIESLNSEYKIQVSNISKGSMIIGNIGKSIAHNNIVFIDNNDDNIVDMVWISTKFVNSK